MSGTEGVDARRTALLALAAVEGGGRSDRCLDRQLRRDRLEDRDRRLATEIVYGSLRRRRALERALAPHLRRPWAALDPEVRAALLVGAYQVACLDTIPGHAAVDTTVEAIKSVAARAAGLVNGVLRSWMRTGGELPDPGGDVAERLHAPRWLVDRFRDRHGAAAAEAWLAACLEPAVHAVRLHGGPSERRATLESLAADGVELEASPWLEDGFRVVGGDLIGSRAFRNGEVTPRSEAAQLVTSLLPGGGGAVLDACAGRGGKAIQLAEERPRQRVVGADISAARLRAAGRRGRELGLGNLSFVAADLARIPPLARSFDRILLDAPCSGLGTLRRHPEIRWRITPRRLRPLADLQRRILGRVAERLAPGGYLLYVTCSTEPEENEEVTGAALAEDPELEPVALSPTGPAARLVAADGSFRTCPGAPDLDGFYARLLRRRGPGQGA